MELEMDIKFKENEPVTIPYDYHAEVLSIIKNAVKNYSLNDFERLFSWSLQKTYCWSMSFIGSGFSDAGNQLHINFRFLQDKDAFLFYSALHDYDFSLNSRLFSRDFNLTRMSLSDEKKVSSKIRIRTVSNIVLAVESYETGKKKYLEKFNTLVFKDSLENKIKSAGKEYEYLLKYVDDLAIVPLNEQTRWNSLYGTKIPTISGEFIVVGNKDLVNFMLNSGIGQETGSGFGLAKVVQAFD
ncbi:MAG TPA: hypothetical protein DCS83_07770 [Prevotella sp.]|nr:hypothetical protein [Prevotella sp.]